MIIIDPGSPLSPYAQVRAQYAEQITAGDLVVGTRLPSVRRLARDLALATNTVAKAYRELEADGLVETRGRAGTIVAASGDDSRNQLEASALAYVKLTTRLGIDRRTALKVVSTALRES